MSPETPVWSFRWVKASRRRTERIATARGLTLTEAVEEAIEQWVEREEPKLRGKK